MPAAKNAIIPQSKAIILRELFRNLSPGVDNCLEKGNLKIAQLLRQKQNTLHKITQGRPKKFTERTFRGGGYHSLAVLSVW
jgi:hypothetical protein